MIYRFGLEILVHYYDGIYNDNKYFWTEFLRPPLDIFELVPSVLVFVPFFRSWF